MQLFHAILPAVLILTLVVCLFLSQRYWLRLVRDLEKRAKHPGWRALLRFVWLAMLLGITLPVFIWILGGLPRSAKALPLVGMWLSTSLFAWLLIKAVKGMEWAWVRLRARTWRSQPGAGSTSTDPVAPVAAAAGEALESPSRRYFFQTAAYLAGAVPFVGALYGFAAGRLRYTVERVEVPLPNLPAALDGLRIAQLSDFHMSGYMTANQVRRAVDMANYLGAELAIVTGDFITGRADPLEECVQELSRLRAPLGVWGCLGNHEIYAQCEREATALFGQVGVRILRHQNAEIVWRGQALNLIGVDYQRMRQPDGSRAPMLEGIELLVRERVPNVLLSHNPNAFPRASDLGVALTLAGHTHGGQINVEILEQRLNPARFFTDFIAGLYERPMGRVRRKAAPLENMGNLSTSQPLSLATQHSPRATAFLYVNRGLGTVGTPVRLGAPPEITLLTLRRA